MKKNTIFKMGDVVWSQHFGCGHVTSTNVDTGTPYVIEVTWEGAVLRCDYFTYDGQYDLDDPDPDCDIHPITDVKPLEYSKEKRSQQEEQKTGSATFGAWLNGAKNYALMQVEKRKAGSNAESGTRFREGDKVVSRAFGIGVVTKIAGSDHTYPVIVKWDDNPTANMTFSAFTLKGHYFKHRSDADKDIVLLGDTKTMEDDMKEELKVGDWVWLNPDEKGIITFIYPNKEKCIVDSELDGEVETVMAGLTKVEYSPINPSHYRVAGIPEAIDIMKHLMTQEQFKGFLWGNIIKYAYRYGRKGDEHDTAGKIEWYANRLREVCAEEKKKKQERE